MSLALRFRTAIRKPFVPALFFFGGVSFDTLMLTRIDRLLDNLVLLLYLIVLGVLIVLMGRQDSETSGAGDMVGTGGGSSSSGPPSASVAAQGFGFVARARPYYSIASQFLLGSLFSAYAIFYSRSASLTSTAVFFFLLVGLLIGNEFLHDRRSNLKLMVALYTLAACSFLTFFLPVVTGVMNTAMFLFGAMLSAALAMGIVRLIYKREGRPELFRTSLPALGVIACLIGFYFLNWIPPVPLSMPFGGIYHTVSRSEERYLLTFERPRWYQFWKHSDDPFRGETAHCFTAVFAPVDLHTEIYHHWQYRETGGEKAGRFATTDRIRLTIAGGRQGGYRAYTVKQRVVPGDWRVDVETAQGSIIGRVSFRVEEASDSSLELVTITY
jgi:DUF2914 family protein